MSVFESLMKKFTSDNILDWHILDNYCDDCQKFSIDILSPLLKFCLDALKIEIQE